jgi:hypothetical protein
MTRNNVGFTFRMIFYPVQRCLIGSLLVMKPGVFKTTREQNARACSGKHRIHIGWKKHSCLTCSSDHACVFLQSQGNSSLWIHCTKTNGESTCYLEVLTRCRESVWWKRPALWPDKWILHHDHAPAHDGLIVRQFLAKKSIHLIHLT